MDEQYCGGVVTTFNKLSDRDKKYQKYQPISFEGSNTGESGNLLYGGLLRLIDKLLQR